jgi:hypothetical protein
MKTASSKEDALERLEEMRVKLGLKRLSSITLDEHL